MSTCACIRSTYDFDLNQTKCSDIVYIDRSTFQEGNSTKQYELSVEDEQGNVKTYQVVSGVPIHLDLGSCLKPGVFVFKATSCTKEWTKKTAIVCGFECGYLKAAAKLGTIDSTTLRSIRERIDHIPNLVSQGDIVSANEILDQVRRTLRQINCSCECS